MRAQVGDRICVNSPVVSQPPRIGRVLDVREGATEPRYRVAWDDGSESTFFPHSGAAIVLEHDSHEPEHHDSIERFGCHIDVAVTEQDGVCEAVATMITPRGHFAGEGTSRRHPDDPSVPLIGEELAIARALRKLSGQLEMAAMEAIADEESRPIHLLSPT